MQISSTELKAALGSRYPGAAIHVLDREYRVLDRSAAHKSLKRFHRVMRGLGLIRWVTGKLDCDKWAWLFKAYHIYLSAIQRKRKKASAVGFICYYVNGQRYSGHAANFIITDLSGDLNFSEVDPIPGRSFIELTEAERQSVWLIII